MGKTEYQIEIIGRLKEFRREKGKSQIDVSRILELSEGQVGNIEMPQYSHKYTLKQIYKLCVVFNKPIEHLFLDENDFSSDTEIINLLIEKIIQYGE